MLMMSLLFGVAFTTYAQINPPEPQAADERDSPPCDPGGDGGGGVTVPVGLCVPIDDYVYLLMGVGLMYGCYKLRDFKIA